MKRFEDMESWQEARILTKMVYDIVNDPKLPKDDVFRNNITRASIEVMNNIASGFNCQNNKDVGKYLSNCISSLSEIQSTLYVALDQNYIDQNGFNRIYRQLTKTRKELDDNFEYLKKKKDYSYYKSGT